MKATTVRRKKKEVPEAVIGIGGRFRVNIVNPDGSIAGDSGWKKNVLTNVGVNDAILGRFMGLAASTQKIGYFALGRGQASITVGTDSMASQCAGGTMVAVTTAASLRTASSDGATARYTANFTSNAFAASTTVGQAGLHFTTSGASSTALICAATFASSTVATNQAINCSYDVIFSATVSNN
jgi:hypothetical protein